MPQFHCTTTSDSALLTPPWVERVQVESTSTFAITWWPGNFVSASTVPFSLIPRFVNFVPLEVGSTLVPSLLPYLSVYFDEYFTGRYFYLAKLPQSCILLLFRYGIYCRIWLLYHFLITFHTIPPGRQLFWMFGLNWWADCSFITPLQGNEARCIAEYAVFQGTSQSLLRIKTDEILSATNDEPMYITFLRNLNISESSVEGNIERAPKRIKSRVFGKLNKHEFTSNQVGNGFIWSNCRMHFYACLQCAAFVLR